MIPGLLQRPEDEPLRFDLGFGALSLGVAGADSCHRLFASRVIGLFEGAIGKLVALVTLMPIVAGIGGNPGKQTITLIVRATALDQIGNNAMRRLCGMAMGVALFNGLIWGGVIGIVAGWMHHSLVLSRVMTVAMTLNLLLEDCMGVAMPMTMIRMGATRFSVPVSSSPS